MKTEDLNHFLDQLREHGFQLGLDAYQYANQLASRFEPVRLKTLLCPLLVQNDRQQEQFYQLFDYHFLHIPPVNCEPVEEEATMDVVGPSNAAKAESSKSYSWGLSEKQQWWAWAMFTLLMGIAISMYVNQPETSTSSSPITVESMGNTGGSEGASTAGHSSFYPYQDHIKWGLLALLALCFLVSEYWNNRRDKNRLAKARAQRQTPPYLHELQAGQSGLAMAFSGARPLLNDWRRQVHSNRLLLDIKGSIRSTIRRGGYAQLEYRRQRRAAEYLLLVDLNTSNHHQIQLLDTFYRVLAEHNVYTERYYFQGDPRVCWNESQSGGISLRAMHQQYPFHQLLMISTGAFLLQSGDGARYCRRQLEQWKQPVLMSTRPVSTWGREEHLLTRHFSLLPANKEGLDKLISQLEGKGVKRNIDDWRRALPKEHILKVDPERPEESLREKGVKPASAIAKWVAACALYPGLEWAITIRLGEVLGKEFPGLLSLDNLFVLNRISWFRQGKIPEACRQQLTAGLTSAEAQLYRSEIVEVLRENLPQNEHSRAYREQALQLAKQEALLQPQDPKKLKALQQWLPRELKPDFALRALMENKRRYVPSILLPLLPYIFKNGFPLWGMIQQVRRGVWVIALMVAWLLFFAVPGAQFPIAFRGSPIALKGFSIEAKEPEPGIPEPIDSSISNPDIKPQVPPPIVKPASSGEDVYINVLGEDNDLLSLPQSEVLKDTAFEAIDITVEVPKEPGLKDVIMFFGRGIDESMMLELDEESSTDKEYVFKGTLFKKKQNRALGVQMTAHAAGKESKEFRMSLRHRKRRVVF